MNTFKSTGKIDVVDKVVISDVFLQWKKELNKLLTIETLGN